MSRGAERTKLSGGSAGGAEGVTAVSEGVEGASGSLVAEESEPPKRRFNQLDMRAMLQGAAPGRASSLLVVGGAGFFGPALSAAGGFNWLPIPFEWPVGNVDGVMTTPDGKEAIPEPCDK